MSNLRQIVLDTETTGLDPAQGHRLIEVAAIEMIDRRVTGNYVHYYIHPERDIDPGAQKVHGISLDFLKDKPKFAEIADALWAYLDGSELIIHNAVFDLGFLDHEFKRYRKTSPKLADICSIIDTLDMARKKHRGQKNNLDALCKRYNIDNSGRDWHGALIDAELLSGVYLAMTGGQMTLFDALDNHEATSSNHQTQIITEKTIQNTTVTTKRTAKALRVLKASWAEQAMHDDYLTDF